MAIATGYSRTCSCPTHSFPARSSCRLRIDLRKGGFEGGALVPGAGNDLTVSRGLFFKASYLHRFQNYFFAAAAAFCFAQRRFCASEIAFRAAADILRRLRPPVAFA